ncbi:MAG: WG repeat-containing protein [Sphingobacteriales bacterium]|nr:MAG: WG repeat-containing protein [Sphingobacteriales bacterium]
MTKAFFRTLLYGFLFLGFYSLQAQTLAAVKRNNHWFYIDQKGTIVFSKVFEAAGDRFTDGLAPVMLKGKWGYIDATGKIVIAPAYDKALNFFNQSALVKKGANWIFIDKKGKNLNASLPQIIDIDTVTENIILANTPQGKIYILPSRKILTPAKDFDDLQPFSNGLARVKKNGKYGFIDTTGTLKITCIYENASRFNDNIACVQTGVSYDVIDKNGDKVQPLTHLDDVGVFTKATAALQIYGEYNIVTLGVGERIKTGLKYGDADPSTYVYPFVDDMARFFMYNSNTKKFLFGYLTPEGKKVNAFQYDWAHDFSEGLAAVKQDGKYNYINKRGELVIDTGFDDAHNFYKVK